MQIVILLLALALLGFILLRSKNRRGSRPESRRPPHLNRSNQRAIAAMQSVDDPQLAATTMMAAIANHAGPMNRQQQAAIVEQAMVNFEIDEPTAIRLLAQSHSMVQGVKDLDQCFAVLVPTIQGACTPEERDDLLDMLAEIASHCPDSSAPEIGSALAKLRNKVS